MAHEPLLAILMSAMALRDGLEGVSLNGLIDDRSEDGSGDVDEDGNGSVGVEGVAAVENGGDDARAQVTRQVGGDGDVCKAPDHVGVGDADYERG